MNMWNIKKLKDIKLRNPVLIEGLPGIGNVGKVAVDFLIEELHAKKIYEISSYTLPHSVFVNEEDLIELPKIEMYAVKNNKHFLLLGGDVQPSDEVSCYKFCEEIINICRKHSCTNIITLGGIGLMEIPKKPKVYCTGNSKEAVLKYKDRLVQNQLYGIVGPIVGVSGVLLGLAENIHAVAFLAETYGHPMYLGVKGAKEILKVLNKRFEFGLELEKLDREIKDIEEDMLKRTEELSNVSRKSAAQKLKSRLGTDVTYIG